MKINLQNSSQDFVKYYLTRFVDPKVKEHSFFKEMAKDLKIDLERLQSLSISSKEVFDFVVNDKVGKFQEFIPIILKEYKPIPESNLKILEEVLSPLVNRYFEYLKYLFGVDSDILEFDLLLIPTRVEKKNSQKNYFASVHRGKPTAIFLVIYLGDDLSKEETLLMYLKVFFHEFTHIFLNKNKEFDNFLLKIKETKYPDLDISFPRVERPIKELLCMNMSFATYDFGLAFNFFGWQEDLEIKNKVLEKNNFFSITHNFLFNLSQSDIKDKLESFLGNYMEDLIQAGLLKASYKDLYKI